MASSPALPAPIILSQCPSCAATYVVPAERMGSAGARIRCPRCERVYDLKRTGHRVAAGEPPPVDRSERDRVEGRADSHDAFAEESDLFGVRFAEESDSLGIRSAEVVARIAVEEIGDARAREMVAADAEGALFARHGAALLDAFDRYRARAGAAAPAAVFLRALRDRLGIDIPSWKEYE